MRKTKQKENVDDDPLLQSYGRCTFFPDPLGSRIFSGLMSFMTQTAAMTVLIGRGGFFMDLTSVMSAGFSVSRAAKAAVSNQNPIHFITHFEQSHVNQSKAIRSLELNQKLMREITIRKIQTDRVGKGWGSWAIPSEILKDSLLTF